MDRPRLERALDDIRIVYAACGASFAIGLFFIFAWAPHPWGHEGFDHYHQLALTLASGGAFPTMEYPWGYAYFLAAFYRLFGDHPAVPLVTQAAMNAALPLVVFAAARTWFERRTAAIAAVITGVASFNTVYASTQSSDAVCTVIFMSAVLAFLVAQRRNDLRWSALAGVLAGLAPQFRPNLVLVPLVLAGYLAIFARHRRWTAHAALLLGCAALALAPWIVRNYRLTHMLVPASLRGGLQLWYGSLQVGPYLHSGPYNPRTIFESAVFGYTSLDDLPLIVTAHQRQCYVPAAANATLVYWSDRDATHRTAPGRLENGTVTFEAPEPSSPAVFYYYLTTDSTAADGVTGRTTPVGGAETPSVFFISQDHLGDLDLHGDLVDSFDLVRMMRHLAWNEPLPFAGRLESTGIGDRGLDTLIAILERRYEHTPADAVAAAFTHDATHARLMFADGSSIVVPHEWRGVMSDVLFNGAMASGLMTSSEPVEALHRARVRGTAAADAAACTAFEEVAVNAVFYRRQPHMMRRYTALAFDNIEDAPLQFAAASAYRMLRLFVIRGDGDWRTSQQFEHSGRVYGAATVASALFAALLVCGVVIARRRGDAIALPLLLIVYVPLTIAPMLTNMRYTVTVQPLAFMFVAVTVNALLERAGPRHKSRIAGR